MKMDLIQPFIGSLDAVLAQMTGAPVTIADVTMEEEAYRRKGIAALGRFPGTNRRPRRSRCGPWRRRQSCRKHVRRGSRRLGTDGSRGHLRARQHGDRQRRHTVERSRLAIQSFAAFNSYRRAMRKNRLRFGSDHPFLPHSGRRSSLEHFHALSHTQVRRAFAGSDGQVSPTSKIAPSR